MTRAFEIEILRTSHSCPEPIHDTCLSGHLRVTINGTAVADDDDFAVAVSARALLRTVDRDHDAANPVIHNAYLLSHDCGFPDFACSNFGTTWAVRHGNGVVQILDVESHASAPLVRDLRFPEAEIDVPLEQYRDEVLRFATDARAAYFADGERQIADDEERSLYEGFWAEYDELIARHASA